MSHLNKNSFCPNKHVRFVHHHKMTSDNEMMSQIPISMNDISTEQVTRYRLMLTIALSGGFLVFVSV